MVHERISQLLQRGAAAWHVRQRGGQRSQLLQSSAAAAQRTPLALQAGRRPLDPFADFLSTNEI